MTLSNMKFGDYIWPHNPESINISSSRNIKDLTLPFSGYVFQDYGRDKRVVNGKGEFFGEDCVDQFEKLFFVYNEGKQNMLYVPGIAQFNALFKNLEITCETIPNLIIYKFEFWETFDFYSENNSNLKRYHIVEEGENLYYISEMYGISLTNIFKLNPSIRNLNNLEIGRKVILR